MALSVYILNAYTSYGTETWPFDGDMDIVQTDNLALFQFLIEKNMLVANIIIDNVGAV